MDLYTKYYNKYLNQKKYNATRSFYEINTLVSQMRTELLINFNNIMFLPSEENINLFLNLIRNIINIENNEEKKIYDNLSKIIENRKRLDNNLRTEYKELYNNGIEEINKALDIYRFNLN